MHHNTVVRLTTSLPPRIIDIDFCFMPFKIIYLYSVSSLSSTTAPLRLTQSRKSQVREDGENIFWTK